MLLNQHPKDDICILGRYGDKRLVAPGSMVCHREFDKSSYGMVVHVNDTDVTVLWTHEPQVSNFDFRALASPLARGLGYAKIAQQVIKIESLPGGAHVFYAKDEDE